MAVLAYALILLGAYAVAAGLLFALKAVKLI